MKNEHLVVCIISLFYHMKMLPLQYTDSYISIIPIVQVSAAHNWNHCKHCIRPLLFRMSVSSVEVYEATYSWLEITFTQINALLVLSVSNIEFQKYQLQSSWNKDCVTKNGHGLLSSG
jgi:hypothetical protein